SSCVQIADWHTILKALIIAKVISDPKTINKNLQMGRVTCHVKQWPTTTSKKGEVGLVVLTCYLPIPIPFPTCFSAHQPPPSSHLHPIILPDVLGTGCVRSRWVVVEEWVRESGET